MARREATMALMFAGVLLGSWPALANEADCLIEPWREITLAAPTEGVVQEVRVDRGDFVEKGQVVASLDSRVAVASVKTARARAEARGSLLSSEARLSFADKALRRQQELAARNIASQRDRDEAESVKQVADADARAAREAQNEARLELEQTRAILAQRTIRAPFSGVVVERILSPGEFADPPQLMRIAQLDPLRVEVFAPMSLFGQLEKGMKAVVSPEDPVGGSYEATLTVVDHVIDPTSGTFGVRLELPNPDHALPAGLHCRVRFPDTESSQQADSAIEPVGAAPTESLAAELMQGSAIEPVPELEDMPAGIESAALEVSAVDAAEDAQSAASVSKKAWTGSDVDNVQRTSPPLILRKQSDSWDNASLDCVGPWAQSHRKEQSCDLW